MVVNTIDIHVGSEFLDQNESISLYDRKLLQDRSARSLGKLWHSYNRILGGFPLSVCSHALV